MYTIGICDDESLYREHLRTLCERYFSNIGEEYQCVEFSTGEELLAYENGKLHLLFLDIEMPGINGIEVLRKVENYDWIWRVVFVSSHEELVWKAFSIKTLEFARKPVSHEQVSSWLNIMMREHKANKTIYFENGNSVVTCEAEELYYLEADRNYTVAHKKEEKLLLSGNMRSWEQKIEIPSFLRVHKSYLINMIHIEKWSPNMVILTNGAAIPVERKFAEEVKELS